jgi:hypothetical protein
MNYRCPACNADLGRKTRGRDIVSRMEMDCAQCKVRLRFNVHKAEAAVIVLDFAAIILLGALAYWLQSQVMALLAFGAAALGAAVLPLLERIWLREWPRYVLIGAR